jgi:hypothetical protein
MTKHRALYYVALGWLVLCAAGGVILAVGVAVLPHAQAPLGPAYAAGSGLTVLASPAARYLKRWRP